VRSQLEASSRGTRDAPPVGVPTRKSYAQKKCVWVRPEVVARIEYLEWTERDHLRHSKFTGLREDKNARSVVKELTGKSVSHLRVNQDSSTNFHSANLEI